MSAKIQRQIEYNMENCISQMRNEDDNRGKRMRRGNQVRHHIQVMPLVQRKGALIRPWLDETVADMHVNDYLHVLRFSHGTTITTIRPKCKANGEAIEKKNNGKYAGRAVRCCTSENVRNEG